MAIEHILEEICVASSVGVVLVDVNVKCVDIILKMHTYVDC